MTDFRSVPYYRSDIVRAELAEVSRHVAIATRRAPAFSAARLRRLLQAFEGTLRGCYGADIRLRHVVQAAVAELQAQGIDAPACVKMIVTPLASHPRVYSLDRVSVVDGSHSVDRLLERVREWVTVAVGSA